MTFKTCHAHAGWCAIKGREVDLRGRKAKYVEDHPPGLGAHRDQQRPRPGSSRRLRYSLADDGQGEARHLGWGPKGSGATTRLPYAALRRHCGATLPALLPPALRTGSISIGRSCCNVITRLPIGAEIESEATPPRPVALAPLRAGL